MTRPHAKASRLLNEPASDDHVSCDLCHVKPIDRCPKRNFFPARPLIPTLVSTAFTTLNTDPPLPRLFHISPHTCSLSTFPPLPLLPRRRCTISISITLSFSPLAFTLISAHPSSPLSPLKLCQRSLGKEPGSQTLLPQVLRLRCLHSQQQLQLHQLALWMLAHQLCPRALQEWPWVLPTQSIDKVIKRCVLIFQTTTMPVWVKFASLAIRL